MAVGIVVRIVIGIVVGIAIASNKNVFEVFESYPYITDLIMTATITISLTLAVHHIVTSRDRKNKDHVRLVLVKKYQRCVVYLEMPSKNKSKVIEAVFNEFKEILDRAKFQVHLLDSKEIDEIIDHYNAVKDIHKDPDNENINELIKYLHDLLDDALYDYIKRYNLDEKSIRSTQRNGFPSD